MPRNVEAANGGTPLVHSVDVDHFDSLNEHELSDYSDRELTTGLANTKEHGPAPAVGPLLRLADNAKGDIDLIGSSPCFIAEQESVDLEMRLDWAPQAVKSAIS